MKANYDRLEGRSDRNALRIERSLRVALSLAACAGILIAAVSLAPPATTAAPQAGGVHQGIPPTSLRGAHKSPAPIPTDVAGLEGVASFSTTQKKVVVRWMAAYQGEMTVLDSQTESTSYWPTEIAPFGTLRLLVAGKDPLSHATIIELWTFSEFVDPPLPVLDSATGVTKFPDIAQRVSRKPIYNAGVVGRDMVRILFHNHGNDRVLCQFDDQRDLYSLDPTSGAIERVLAVSPDPAQPELLVEPALTDDYVDRRAFEHMDYGYIYTLGYPPNYTDDPSLYLFDVDEDGTIDQVHVVDGPTWRSLGLNDPLRYVKSFY